MNLNLKDLIKIFIDALAKIMKVFLSELLLLFHHLLLILFNYYSPTPLSHSEVHFVFLFQSIFVTSDVLFIPTTILSCLFYLYFIIFISGFLSMLFLCHVILHIFVHCYPH